MVITATLKKFVIYIQFPTAVRQHGIAKH